MIDKRVFSVALMLLAIFVAGGFCGWWVGRNQALEETEIPVPPTGRPPRLAQKEYLLNEFTRRLSLTPQQRTNVNQVLEGWMQHVQEADREQLQARHEAFQKFSPMVRTNLTVEQQDTYDGIAKQTDRRFKRMLQRQ